jgi:hypothetical protein
MMDDSFDQLFQNGGDGLDGVAPPRRGPKVKAEDDPSRFIGCPLWWFEAVYPIVRSKGELAVAMFLYRQRIVQGSKTITVTNVRLSAEIGVSRYIKYRAIKILEDAGLISVRRSNKKALELTFRQPRRSKKKV